MKPTTVSRRFDADPDAVFRMVVDVGSLPTWNDAIIRVLDVPTTMTVGDEWVVEMSALGRDWASRARLVELDHAGRRFAYRSVTDDGNASYAEWTWAVDAAPGGCEVAVTWTLNPRTFWRRVLLGRIRQHQLRTSEVPASLAALKGAVEAAVARE